MFAQFVITIVLIFVIFFGLLGVLKLFTPKATEKDKLEDRLLDRKRELAKAKLLVKTVEEEEKIQKELLKVNGKLNKLRRKKDDE